MHPEAEIASAFWKYVNERGHGNAGDYYPHPPALMMELERQYWVADQLGDQETLRRYLVPGREEEPQPWVEFGWREDGHHLPPTGFATLQEALYDYLLAHVGDLLIAGCYELWLRAVAHMVGDVARDPHRLVIPVAELDNIERTTDHTMTVSDDWGVLRRETFDFACRNYERHWNAPS
jgi:hypothetical protein